MCRSVVWQCCRLAPVNLSTPWAKRCIAPSHFCNHGGGVFLIGRRDVRACNIGDYRDDSEAWYEVVAHSGVELLEAPDSNSGRMLELFLPGKVEDGNDMRLHSTAGAQNCRPLCFIVI